MGIARLSYERRFADLFWRRNENPGRIHLDCGFMEYKETFPGDQGGIIVFATAQETKVECVLTLTEPDKFLSSHRESIRDTYIRIDEPN